MNKIQYRVVLYDNGATPDKLLMNIGDQPVAIPELNFINLNLRIFSLNKAVNKALSFGRRFQADGMADIRYEVYGKVIDDIDTEGEPAAPVPPIRALTNGERAEQLYLAGDVPEYGLVQRINLANRSQNQGGAALADDFTEDAEQDNG